MAISTSLFLLAIGAILAFAVDYRTEGIDVNAVGVILMVVGGIGFLFSLLFLATFAPFRINRHHDPYDEVSDHRHSHDWS